ncbi:unnamed protein product [Lactuca virosa]|uniref:Mitochondrial import inner membrane translocase subunit TIM50 n=1 Tax=Lactuca virosa TaxID=75947 RepID=A0AAU9NWA7_9ASTR|nr:unnamed protein product [Lactuca virosa]
MSAEESKIKNVAVASSIDTPRSEEEKEEIKSETGTDVGFSLDKLSLGPKKKLLVIPLGGLIVHRAHVRERFTLPKNRRPDLSYGKFMIYKRPFCEGFLKFCFERFEVGLWSSAMEHNIKAVLNHVTGDVKTKFLFTMDQKECTDTGFTCSDGELRAFLDGVAEAKDVQSYVKDHPFGEPAITPSHSDWDYYSKIIRFFDKKDEAFNFQGNGFSCQGLHKDLHTSTETEDKMKGRLLPDVIVFQCPVVLELFSGEDQTLLVWRNTFLVLNFSFDVVNGARVTILEKSMFIRALFTLVLFTRVLLTSGIDMVNNTDRIAMMEMDLAKLRQDLKDNREANSQRFNQVMKVITDLVVKLESLSSKDGEKKMNFKGFQWRFIEDSDEESKTSALEKIKDKEEEEEGNKGKSGSNFKQADFRKIEMPIFNEEDSHGWIYRVEPYYEIQGIEGMEQLKITTLCMKGVTLAWYRSDGNQTPFWS